MKAAQAAARAKQTPAQRAARSAKIKARWADPNYRAKMAAARKAHPSKPMSSATRARLAAANKARWADPNYRARMAALRSARPKHVKAATHTTAVKHRTATGHRRATAHNTRRKRR
jgi:hypothetical protein